MLFRSKINIEPSGVNRDDVVPPLLGRCSRSAVSSWGTSVQEIAETLNVSEAMEIFR